MSKIFKKWNYFLEKENNQFLNVRDSLSLFKRTILIILNG